MAVPKQWKRRFLEVLRETANVRLACTKAGVSRAGAYKARDQNRKFAEEWDEAIEDAVDAVELAAMQRAVGGVERRRPIYMKIKVEGKDGKVAEKVVKVDEVIEKYYSDAILLKILSAYRPEKYRERYEVKNAGAQKIVVEYVNSGSGEDDHTETD